MSDYIHAITNVVMLSTALLFSLILLCASLFKKSNSLLDRPFTRMVSLTVLMELVGILAWLYGIVPYPLLLYKIVLALDYFVVYIVSVAFFLYLHTLLHTIKEPESSTVPKVSSITVLIAILLCALSMGLYISSYWNGWFYTFDAKGLIHYTKNMPRLQMISSSCMLYALFIILKNRRQLERGRLWLMLAYVVLPLLFFATDLDNELSLGYVVMAAVDLLIYANINLSDERRMMVYQTELAKKEAEMSEARMELMLMQIQPHFLYNVLSTISYLCTHDPKDARQAVSEFSSYLKGNMDSINAKLPVAFDTELAHVRNYLALEKRRFPSRLIVSYDIGPHDFLIPTLTLQTLVENAVRHGVNARFEPTTVTIRTDENPGHWVVRVEDDGPGFDPSQMPSDGRRHIGLAGAQYRVQEMMGGQVLIDSAPDHGTTVTILLPKQAEQQRPMFPHNGGERNEDPGCGR